jgi:hypothetical protein
MRALLSLVVIMVTPACGEQRSFDERYDEVASNIVERAAEIDSALNDSSNQSGSLGE